MAKEQGHSVTFVTYRSPYVGNHDIEADANELGIDIVFTSGKQKRHCFKADVWIDDSPECIPTAVQLGEKYDSCLMCNDMYIVT